jgi:hypothetical protein
MPHSNEFWISRQSILMSAGFRICFRNPAPCIFQSSRPRWTARIHRYCCPITLGKCCSGAAVSRIRTALSVRLRAELHLVSIFQRATQLRETGVQRHRHCERRREEYRQASRRRQSADLRAASAVEGRAASQRAERIPARHAEPNESKSAQIAIIAASLAYWNEQKHGWEVERDPVKIMVGRSSADLSLDKTVTVE